MWALKAFSAHWGDSALISPKGNASRAGQAALTAGAWEDERGSVVPGGNAGELGLANVEEGRRAPEEATEYPANRESSSLTAPAVSVVPCGQEAA